MIGSQRISPSLSENIASQQVLLSKQCGFTLIEMLIVIAILGILASVSSGAFSSDNRDADLKKDAVQGLHAVLTSARFVALAKGRPVRVTVYGALAPAGVRNTFSATHLGGAWDAVNNVSNGGNKFFPKVQFSSANANCTAFAPLVSKTFQFNPSATVGIFPGGVTYSVRARSDNAGVVGDTCLQVRSVTGRTEVIEK